MKKLKDVEVIEKYKDSEVRSLPVNKIIEKIECQNRITESNEIVKEYMESMKNGDKFPPIKVFIIDGEYILVDGHHRLRAVKNLKDEYEIWLKKRRDDKPTKNLTEDELKVIKDNREWKKIDSIIAGEGSLKDAIIEATMSNTKHGFNRTSEDKRKAIKNFIENIDDITIFSEREIARKLKVTTYMVSNVLKEIDLKGRTKQDRVRKDIQLFKDDKIKYELNRLEKAENSAIDKRKSKDRVFKNIDKTSINIKAIEYLYKIPRIKGIIELNKSVIVLDKDGKEHRIDREICTNLAEKFIISKIDDNSEYYCTYKNKLFTTGINKKNENIKFQSTEKLITLLNITDRLISVDKK